MRFTDVSEMPLADIELYSLACSYFAQAGPSMAVGACNLQGKSTFNQIVYLPTTESGINENPVPQAYAATNVAQILHRHQKGGRVCSHSIGADSVDVIEALSYVRCQPLRFAQPAASVSDS